MISLGTIGTNLPVQSKYYNTLLWAIKAKRNNIYQSIKLHSI